MAFDGFSPFSLGQSGTSIGTSSFDLFHPFGGPKISSGPPIDHVADANARLSLDPTGKVSGYQVIQDDNGFTYTFTGPGADADAGLWVTLAGTAGDNGAYAINLDTYIQIPTGQNVGFRDRIWSIGGNYDSAPDSATFPWQTASWTITGGDPPAPSVSRNPIASSNNWTP